MEHVIYHRDGRTVAFHTLAQDPGPAAYPDCARGWLPGAPPAATGMPATADLEGLTDVPPVVTLRQAKLAVAVAGLSGGVETALSGLPEPAQTLARIEWDTATSVRRDDDWINAMADAMGLSAAQTDDLFRTAAGL